MSMYQKIGIEFIAVILLVALGEYVAAVDERAYDET